MASASQMQLSRLLLQRSDRHPVGRLNGNDQQAADPAIFAHFLHCGLLIQEPPLSEADGIIFETVGSRVWGFCEDGTADVEAASADDLRQFTIDLTALCRQVRKANNMQGPPVEPMGSFAFRIGALGTGARRRQYFLVRALRAKNALEIAYAIRGQADDGMVVILTPTERNLPNSVTRLLQASQIEIMAIDAHFDESAAEPFTLNLVQTRGRESGHEPLLSIDTGGHRVCFHGADVRLTPREFNILVALTNEAAQDAGVVGHDVLLGCLRGDDEDDGPFPEQLEKAISSIRKALTSAAKLPREHGRKLISSRRRIGYRLDIAAADIRIV